MCSVIWYAIKNKDFAGSNDMDKVIFNYPELVKITRIRLGKERAFVRICCEKSPGMFSYLQLVASLFFSAKKKKVSGHNRSYYRFLTLHFLKEKYPENSFGLLEMAKKYYFKKMMEHYQCEEHEVLFEITKKYLWNPDSPIFDLAKEIREDKHVF